MQLWPKHLPKWFKILNSCILLPILLWPFVFYTTIFLFDNPKNMGQTYLVFFAINAYPIYLVIITYLNSLLFQKNKILGSILPSTVLLTLVLSVAYLAFEMSQAASRNMKRDNERRKQGYIGVSNDYKIIDDKVYCRDTLIIGADAKTFEIVSWNWERDKNYYYFFGKKVEYIDRGSFKDLDYHYGKDKFNVYYDNKIIQGADAKTFLHIDGSQDGRDANSCYSWGEKVDCAILKDKE